MINRIQFVRRFICIGFCREFNGREDQHSVELCSTNVTIIPSPGDHDHGSSKVKLKNIVDFTWDHHFYTGQLLAVHVSGKYLAYGLKGNIQIRLKFAVCKFFFLQIKICFTCDMF